VPSSLFFFLRPTPPPPTPPLFPYTTLFRSREIGRGGQVFFITPTIGNMGQRARDHRLPTPDEPRKPTRPRDDDRTIDEWTEYLRSEEHTSALQSLTNLVCRLLLEKKKK